MHEDKTWLVAVIVYPEGEVNLPKDLVVKTKKLVTQKIKCQLKICTARHPKWSAKVQKWDIKLEVIVKQQRQVAITKNKNIRRIKDISVGVSKKVEAVSQLIQQRVRIIKKISKKEQVCIVIEISSNRKT